MSDESKWARWKYGNRLGRWHAIASKAKGMTSEGTVVDAVRLACGRIRVPPAETAPRPNDDACCPTCRELDDMRLNYLKGTRHRSPELVTA